MSKRPYQLWIFCDESGDVAHTNERYVIISLIMSDRINLLQRVVTDTKRKGPRAMGRNYVLHAAEEYPEVNQYLLRRLARETSVQLGVLIFDKRWWVQRVQSDKGVYQALAAYAVDQAITGSGVAREEVKVILEQRYPHPEDRARLEAAVADQAGLELDQVLCERKSSTDSGAALQVADVVAWSFYQKWERADGSFAEIIAGQATFEKVVTLDRLGVAPVPYQ